MSGAKQAGSAQENLNSNTVSLDKTEMELADIDKAVASMSFEDALAELERIVRGLEGGQQKLEEAIVAYERGAMLKRHCESKLTEAETRVQVIVAASDGALSLRQAD